MLTKERARQIMGHSDRATTVELTVCGARSGDAVTVASTDSAHASASDSKLDHQVVVGSCSQVMTHDGTSATGASTRFLENF